MTDYAQIIGKNLAWLNTMKQSGGYAGPVTHYWSDSLYYIGPGTDWRYEGLIEGFLQLYKKTRQDEFLKSAIECGDFILMSQKKNGAYFNSGFEANPSFNYSGTPHESAVNIGLIELSKQLKGKKLNYKKYLGAALKNVENIQFGRFYDGREKTFLQYEKERAQGIENKFVPNKIATACEPLIKFYELTKNKNYLKKAAAAAEIILRLQDKGAFYGGIYQSNQKTEIITFYTARCIPCLMSLYKHTKNKKYLEASKSAAAFIKKMWIGGEGFGFGFVSSEGMLKKHISPIFLSGSADIIKALLLVKDYEDISEKKYIKNLVNSQDKNGGFRTAKGLSKKSSGESPPSSASWKDVLHVVGWNDKAFNFLAANLEGSCNIGAGEMPEEKIRCSDGEYYETKDFISVRGNENFYFGKKKLFSNGHQALKKVTYTFATNTTGTPNLLARSMFKITRAM